EIAGKLRGRGNDRGTRPGGLPDAAVFVREEEEHFVALDGSANRPAKVVVPVFGLGGGKEVARVQVVVAEELEERAVHSVGSGSRDHIHLGAGITPIFG